MRGLALLFFLGAGLLLDSAPSFATEEEERQRKGPGHQLDLSLPPLHPDGILVASNPKATPTKQPATQEQAGSKVPPPDPTDDADDIDDTRTERDIEPHVEEDSAGALDDMGDVGGDFEE